MLWGLYIIFNTYIKVSVFKRVKFKKPDERKYRNFIGW